MKKDYGRVGLPNLLQAPEAKTAAPIVNKEELTVNAEPIVSNGKALESKFFGAIFTLVGPTVSSSTYMIEQLTLTEEGMADIVATHFPTTDALNSEIALDVQGTAKFETED